MKQTTHNVTHNQKQTGSVQTKGEVSYSKCLPHVNWKPHGRTCAQWCICFISLLKNIFICILNLNLKNKPKIFLKTHSCMIYLIYKADTWVCYIINKHLRLMYEHQCLSCMVGLIFFGIWPSYLLEQLKMVSVIIQDTVPPK